MKLKKYLFGGGLIAGTSNALANFWVIVFAVATVLLIGGCLLYQLYKWHVRLEILEERRKHEATNEGSMVIVPPGVNLTGLIMIDQRHWWMEETNDAAAAPMEFDDDFLAMSPLPWTPPTNHTTCPVIQAVLAPDGRGIYLTIMDDRDWTNAPVRVMNEYGEPDMSLYGPQPARDTIFNLQSSSNLINWTTLIQMGVSAQYPTNWFRDSAAIEKPRQFYRVHP